MQFQLRYLLILVTVLGCLFAFVSVVWRNSQRFSRDIAHQREFRDSVLDTLATEKISNWLLEDPEIQDVVDRFATNNPKIPREQILVVESAGGGRSFATKQFWTSSSTYAFDRQYLVTWPSTDQTKDWNGNHLSFKLFFESNVVDSDITNTVEFKEVSDGEKSQSLINWMAGKLKSKHGIVVNTDKAESASQ